MVDIETKFLHTKMVNVNYPAPVEFNSSSGGCRVDCLECCQTPYSCMIMRPSFHDLGYVISNFPQDVGENVDCVYSKICSSGDREERDEEKPGKMNETLQCGT